MDNHAQSGMTSSGMALAMRPLAAVAPLSAGVEGAVVSAAGASSRGALLGELGSVAKGIARQPLGIGLLAFSSKAGEGSDKVPGREKGVPAALLAKLDNDTNAINYGGLGSEASIIREADRDAERSVSRDNVEKHTARSQSDSDNAVKDIVINGEFKISTATMRSF